MSVACLPRLVSSLLASASFFCPALKQKLKRLLASRISRRDAVDKIQKGGFVTFLFNQHKKLIQWVFDGMLGCGALK